MLQRLDQLRLFSVRSILVRKIEWSLCAFLSGEVAVTFNFGFGSFGTCVVPLGMTKILQTSIGILEKRLSRSSSESTRFEKGLFLFLMLIDHLNHECHFIMVVCITRGPCQPIIITSVFLFQTIQNGAYLNWREPDMNWGTEALGLCRLVQGWILILIQEVVWTFVGASEVKLVSKLFYLLVQQSCRSSSSR